MGRNARARRKRKKEKQVTEEKKIEVADSPAESQGDRALRFKEKGNKAYAARDYDTALGHYTSAIEEDGKNASLYSNRSACYYAMRRYEQALEDAEACIEVRPEWTKGYYRKAEALMSLLRYPEAHMAYEAGLKIDPEDSLLKPGLERLDELLMELKITKEQLNQANNPDLDRFESMCNWLRVGGAKFPMLYLQYYSEDYRGVHCLCKVPNNTVILYVPLKCIMTSEKAKASQIGKKIIQTGCQVRSKHSYLAAYLLQEKTNPQSFWRPYIDILPSKYRNMPIFFTDDEKKDLEGSFTLEKIDNRLASLRREYETICRSVPEFAVHSAWDFIWARLAVITRIFGLNINGKKTDGLVPYADMLNHKPPREGSNDVHSAADTKWTFEDNVNGFTITTLRTIQRGEEIFDSYGRKCNSRFFVNYGFCLENNEDNEVVLKLALPSTDPHYRMKVNLLGGRPTHAQREFQIPANYKETKAKSMFSFLRLAHARDAELALLPSDPNKIEDIEPLSIRNEKLVLEHIARAAEYVLEAYPTTIEEDEKLLEENKGYSNYRNCLLMRHGEKTVLKFYIDLATKIMPMLDMPWRDLKRKAAKSYQARTPFDIYVTSVVVPLVKGQK